jgi:hypothetical protein
VAHEPRAYGRRLISTMHTARCNKVKEKEKDRGVERWWIGNGSGVDWDWLENGR